MLELKEICFSAEDESREVEILNDINLTIDDSFVAVTGPIGSGKSTLAKIIAGILTPTHGQILLDGVDITGLSITERANMGISFAFQQPVRFKGITVSHLSPHQSQYSGLSQPEANAMKQDERKKRNTARKHEVAASVESIQSIRQIVRDASAVGSGKLKQDGKVISENRSDERRMLT